MSEQRDRHALPDSAQEQYAVLEEALDIYLERHRERGDLWKLHGWRGMLHDMRVCTERAWHKWFSAEPVAGEQARDGVHDTDELLDIINYAAMAIRAIRDGNRDGTGGWWNDI